MAVNDYTGEQEKIIIERYWGYGDRTPYRGPQGCIPIS